MPVLAPDQFEKRLREVRLLSLDVDGILTDGGLYYADDGSEMRKFNVKDGMGIKLAMAAGVSVAVVSASRTRSIRHRCRTLGIRHVHVGVADKLEVLESLCQRLGIGWEAVAHMGDDVNDLPVLARAGCPLTVADAVAAVRKAALYVTERRGGDGAVREICDLLMAARAVRDSGSRKQETPVALDSSMG